MSIRLCISVLLLLLVGMFSEPQSLELSYASYLGGNHIDAVSAVVACDDGYYLGGDTNSLDFPVTFDGHQTTPLSPTVFGDGFIARFDADNNPVHATYFSGNYMELLIDMLVLPDGVVTVWDTESTDLDMYYPNAPSPSAYPPNIMIVKYSRDLDEVLWAYSIAGNDWDFCDDMACDGERIVCVGRTYSNDLPTDNDPLDIEDHSVSYMLVLDAATGQQVHFRYMYRHGITTIDIKPDGKLLAGGSLGWNYVDYSLPVSPDAADTVVAGFSEAFVAQYAPDLVLEWLTYLGGNRDDTEPVVKWHAPTNSVMTVIKTSSGDLPIHDTYWPNEFSGISRDLYICCLDDMGREIVWGGYLGGEDWDGGKKPVVIDDAGNLIIGLTTKSQDLPLAGDQLGPAPDESGLHHGYLAMIAIGSKELVCATYQPSLAFHEIYDLDVMNGEIVTVGYFRTDFSTDYLVPTPDALDSTIVGWSEGYILRITDDTIVGIDAPRFTTSVAAPRVTITWTADPDERFDATVTRNGESSFIPVSPAGPERRMEDDLSAADQRTRSVYRIRSTTDPGRVLYEYVLDPVPERSGYRMTVVQSGVDILFQSPSFTADPTEIAVYDLRGRRVLRTGSTLSFHDGVPTHTVSRAALAGVPSGAYIAVAAFADRTAKGRFVLLD